MISTKDIIYSYVEATEKQWPHDRSKTVGASEIGLCKRRVAFNKHGVPQDEGFVDGWGMRRRGDVIENGFWEPAMRWWADKNGWQLLYAGKDQKTFISGYLSATTDGLLVSTAPNALCINLDCKSLDPRSKQAIPKPENKFQVQQQMGVIRECTEYKPSYSILTYIDALDYSKIDDPIVTFDKRIYSVAKQRAEDIMTTNDPMDLMPEGKLAGGKECKWCAWQSRCYGGELAKVPTQISPLENSAVEQLHELRDLEREAANTKTEAENEHAEAVESIKQFLREHDTRGYKGEGWSVSYAVTGGRETLDTQAIKNAGIDLTPYYKTGKSSERLTVK